VNDKGEAVRTLVFHQRRIWRWAAFDPPLRNPRFSGCCMRKVLCLACGEAVGATDDPIDALLLAWRHRKADRTQPR
jgi:hypothetical protein